MDHHRTMLCLCWISALLTVVISCWPTQSSAQHLADELGHHFDLESTADGSMACYYCINVTTNEICNRYAIDVACPADLTSCFTEHVMDARSGSSVSVTKKCATPQLCRKQVGCRASNNQTICVSCCDTSAYCNEEAPVNATGARFHRPADRSGSVSTLRNYRYHSVCVILATWCTASAISRLLAL